MHVYIYITEKLKEKQLGGLKLSHMLSSSGAGVEGVGVGGEGSGATEPKLT